MATTSLIEKRKEREEKFGTEHRYIRARIKRKLVAEDVGSMQAVAEKLSRNPGEAPALVARLNSLLNRSELLFRWLPGNNNLPGKLLFRDQEIGLLIEAQPHCAAKAMKLTPNEETPFSSIPTASALSHLSSKNGFRKLRTGNTRY